MRREHDRRACKTHRSLPVAALIAVFLLQGIAARAQTSQATLQGQVISQASGEPIARALVLQRNLQTNTQGYRYTNEQGIFYFPALQPGTYSVRVDALGYQPEERSPVELAVAARIELNFALQGGGPAQPAPAVPALRRGENPSNILAIMYGADAAVPQAVLIRLPVSVVETLMGAISSLIDENKILELPLSGRDVYTLLVLQPSVSSDNATARGLGFSVNGQQVASSNFLLDGVDNNDLLVTGPATRVSADAVKEYRMTTNNFTAEFGRAAGFIANAITRTGTNQLHGTLFEFFNHDQLNANSFGNNCYPCPRPLEPGEAQGLPKPPFRLNQYGASVGGPLRRDRLFFFGNMELLRSAGESSPVSVLLPSPLLISLAPEGSRAKQLLSRFPPPKGKPILGFPFGTIYTYARPSEQRNSFALGRADYNSLDSRQRLSGRYAFSQQTQDHFSYSVYPDFDAPLTVRGQNLMVNYTRDLYDGTNELKFGYGRNSVRVLRTHSEIPTLTSSFDGVALPGSEAAFDYSFRDITLHVLDNFSRLRGRHALGMGFEWRPGFHQSLVSPARDGLYVFDSALDFLLDSPTFLFIALNRQTRLPATDPDFRRSYFRNEWAAFFQDNLKLTRRLTLNLGMRWEYFGAPSPRQGTQDYNFVFGPGSNTAERIAAGRMENTVLFRPDRNNFAPRFGFAFDVFGSGRSVVRGGYGVFFDRIFNNFWMDARSNNLAFGTLLNIFGLPPRFRYTFPARDGVPAQSVLAPSSNIAVDQGLRTPYSQSWFAGLQQELTPNLALEVNHAGSLGRKLAAADIINRFFSAPRTGANPNGRFNPAEPEILHRNNQGRSDYAALQVALSRRWSRGTQFQVSYTYSRARDVQSDPLGRRTAGAQTSPLGDSSFFFAGISSSFTRQFDPGADYGQADFDQRHNLVFNFIVQSPYVVDLPRIFSGWQAGALAGFRSGFPFSVITTEPLYTEGDDFLSRFYIVPGYGVLIRNRADYWGKAPEEAFLENRKKIPGGVVLLDEAKFAKPPSHQIGNVRRNAFRGPGFWNLDFSLSRSFALSRLGEQASLQFRVEFFNLFNHTNLNNPETSLESFDFGQATIGRQGVGSSLPTVSPLNEQPRHIQLGFKVYF